MVIFVILLDTEVGQSITFVVTPGVIDRMVESDHHPNLDRPSTTLRAWEDLGLLPGVWKKVGKCLYLVCV
jgi:hypothetical protein